MLESEFAGGLNVEFFREKEFELLEELTGGEKERANARNLVRLLMLTQVSGWGKVINTLTIKFAIYEPSPDARQSMLGTLQEGLAYVCEQLNELSLNEKQQRQAEILIASVLTYIPFAYPVTDTNFDVPQYINGNWQMVSYTINPIELTASTNNIPLIFNDSDRVWAYGLAPTSNDLSHAPHLIFSGTTYPSGAGFTSHVESDLRPFHTVGHNLFVTGRQELEAWFNRFPDKKMNVTGVSLGGSLSLLTACVFGDRCQQITALNPAGLVENRALSEIDLWDTFSDKPDVRVVKQGADPVSKFGTWKPDWTILCVDLKKECPHPFTHHFTAFARSPHVLFTQKHPEHDKRSRFFNNIFWYTGGRAVGYTFVLLPWRYLIVPLYRLAKVILLSTYILASMLVSAVKSLVDMIAVALAIAISKASEGIDKMVATAFRTNLQPKNSSVRDIESQEDTEQEGGQTPSYQ